MSSTKRDIRVTYRGHDLAGLKMWRPGHAALYSFDRSFNLHVTAHDPSPAAGHPHGVVRTKQEHPGSESSDDPAAAILIGPPLGDTFTDPLASSRNQLRLGDLLIMLDPGNLAGFRAATKKNVARIYLPDVDADFVTINAWLIPAGHLYLLQSVSPTATLYGLETSDSPWLVLAAELS